jgi:hypothetical protein
VDESFERYFGYSALLYNLSIIVSNRLKYVYIRIKKDKAVPLHATERLEGEEV